MDPSPRPALPEASMDRRIEAVQRLQRSRDALVDGWVERHAPRPQPSHRSSPGRADSGGATGRRRGLEGGWDRWTATPLGLLASQAVRAWWEKSPWRLAGEAAQVQWRQGVQPWVTRHPVLSSALLLGAGVALFKLKPWNEPVLRRRMRVGVAQARHGLLRQLGREPWRSLWMAALAATLVSAEAREGKDAPEVPTPDSPSDPGHREGAPHA